MIDLNHLRTFLAVVKHDSFSAVASEQQLPKSTISRRIKALEAQLGVRLFARHQNHLKITSAGRQLQQQYAEVFHQLGHIEAKNLFDNSKPSGKLKFCMPIDLANTSFARTLIHFCHLYPDIVLECHQSERYQSIDIKEFDAALLIKDGPIPDSDYIVRHLTDFACCLVCSPEFWQALTPQQQQNIYQLTFDSVQCFSHFDVKRWRFSDGVMEESALVSGQLAINNIQIHQYAAETGIGIARIPNFVCDEAVQSGKLMRIETRLPCAPMELCLAYKERHLHSPSIRAFIDFYLSQKDVMAAEVNV